MKMKRCRQKIPCSFGGEKCREDAYLNLPEGEESRILLDCLTNQSCTLSLRMQHNSILCQ